MDWRPVVLAVVIGLAVVAGAYLAGALNLGGGGVCAVRQTESVTIPNTSGRIDHMAYDQQKGLLYVAALGNDTLGVVDVNSGRLTAAVGGFSGPQGVLLLPGGGIVVVTNGGDGRVDLLNASTLALTSSLSLGSDADNVRYDSTTGLLYVAYGDGGIAAIEPTNLSVVGTVALLGHPESFELAPGSSQLYVNVPAGGYVAVVDRSSDSVLERWGLGNASGNYAMALDQADGRLFVATRSPPQLLVLDSATGQIVGQVPVPQDPDDVYFDPGNGCIYVSSGAGFVTAVRQVDPFHYEVAQEVATLPGARTSLLVAGSGLYFVAAPATESSQAEVLVFKL
jgi:DNA-binding beta-propeller fold protein YncE